MARFIHRTARKMGQIPGTPIYVGSERHEAVSIELLEYDQVHVTRTERASLDACLASRTSGAITWANIIGVHDIDTIEALGAGFGLHPLTVEDIVHTGQRPKSEDYEDHLFMVLRMLRWNEHVQRIDDEQVSLVVGASWVLCFQERAGDVFDPIRERLLAGKGRIRKLGADYLAYAILDAIVDHYFSVLEVLGERIEVLGEEMTSNPRAQELEAIRQLKHELLYMRKSVWPLREVLSALQRDESRLLSESMAPFLRDLYDHTIQIIDTVETFRDMLASLTDLYLSSISNRMNEVMKVLTIIATIFIPLSFVAGVYGMNFGFMPELQWRYGYFAALALMLAIAIGMLVYFRRRRWL
jgi:magnesium transporter